MKNSYLIEDDIAVIQPNGKNKHIHFMVDRDDLEKIALHSWRVYAHYRDNSYKRVETSFCDPYSKTSRHISLSRFLCDAKDDQVVDHIDGNPLNNRRNNLRLTTRLGNSQNARKTILPTSSKYKGVSWHRKKQKWIVSVRANKKNYYLGYFTSEKDAAIAYNQKAKELHCEFANLNLVN
jgi:hypothetical protein